MAFAIGSYHTLEVLRETENGFYLGGVGHEDEVLLPRKYTEDAVIGEQMVVFVYTDSEDRPVATTLRPTAIVGDFAYLRVIDVSEHGAFLDWGLDKDLFAPPNEQIRPLEIGDAYVFAVTLDESTQRVKASSRLNPYLDPDVSDVREGEEVEILVYDRADVGMRVVVEGRYRGIVYKDELFRNLRIGEHTRAYVQRVREDGKLDIRMQRSGVGAIDDAKEVVWRALQERGGRLELHDKSAPADIKRELGISKKAFKRAVGGLYKARRIELQDGAIVVRETDVSEADD